MTGEQLRMARAALKLGVRELSALASVDKMSIVGIENGRTRGHAATREKLRSALEKAGIVFLGGKADEYQPTVALRVGVVPVGTDESADRGEGKPGHGLDARAWDEDFAEAAPPAPADPDFPPLEITDEMREEVREYLKSADISPSGRAVLVRDFRL